ncbi:hypothetical protein BV20DRAFT_726305 [Pilatotrama ljubarskyi]|nr:hypothetical protein BV20DRAFT_726305 [Pilatotrama ljubarskyi]
MIVCLCLRLGVCTATRWWDMTLGRRTCATSRRSASKTCTGSARAEFPLLAGRRPVKASICRPCSEHEDYSSLDGVPETSRWPLQQFGEARSGCTEDSQFRPQQCVRTECSHVTEASYSSLSNVHQCV